jgi:hypothetical protein
VSIYLHDHYGSGRTAQVVSTRSPEYKAEPNKYREDQPLTGDESRVAEVSGIEFPQLLSPVDDLPPATVITHVSRTDDGKLLVRGTVIDNGEVKRVLVNGQDATVESVTGQWEVRLAVSGKVPVELTAHSEDVAGNVERLGHQAGG